jgi:ferredoxin-fold anticodon binding domain-containing protein
MQNQINLTPITQFAQIVKSAESTQSKEVKLSIQQARALNLTLLEMLDKLNQDYESLFNLLKKASDPEVISIQLDGGGFEQPK